ncbi:hypothetical protein Asp14428_18480 [Actinoplanes sp. NBRC 14428]|uniref:Peptidase YpeB-like protein n=1 Tax=Pseudosporangium ferrugineum TaxID=439699 RepID=A0A2T0SBK8_9ACTN|nr:hypothetical protein [Pseudosporangium ferrugineum]PRY30814.1 hypothetical protein CLV70_104366 [Pseudosporangium ferrugineum]BCJ50373.1 hypothetical protein Asp14428_18480 [Actinoplanes sp. NBRC 14428]
MTDAELIAIARARAAELGRTSLSDAEVEVLGPEAEVLLRDPRYARGGGLLVIIETATGTVLRVIPQL